MIVDDNKRMRETITNVLAGTNATFFQCSDGDEAISMYDDVTPDWLLMDIELKKLDGLHATEEIKRMHPDARIIMVTNYNDPEFRTEAKRLRTDGYVLKDNLADLRAIVG